MWVPPMPWGMVRADDQGMKLTRTLMSLSVLAATGFGVVAASPPVSAMQKVCIHRSLQLRDHRSEGNTDYFYFEDVCDGWMDTTGPTDPPPPKEGGSGRPSERMTREDECEARAAQLNQLELELRLAQESVLFYEATVRGYDKEETDAGQAEAIAAAEAQAADVALATAEVAYYRAGYDTVRTYMLKGELVEEYVGFDVSTLEGKAVATAQAAQRAAANKLAAARINRSVSNQTSAAEATMRRTLDGIRSTLATHPMRIEQLRREFMERC